ncbi:hypothetical protein SAMN05192558_11717 [Actinokineospora alba]|uniref:Imelysin n=1 Tax=Actinokineospora alba TaxID=504798 RepID=A0A1H0W253_9PSEU|nr:hypothetical protein [Actinokineospora alba]TDP67774.1 hypothetical protein C8E96_3325 [Actinokineospora alba]SDI71613.1 hypothetical protein SAMN05421871_10717 [Actinokineospora alba]SDP84628.1 hypothetical protein SAMN05192558_11717 [Actinokineospora alba]
MSVRALSVLSMVAAAALTVTACSANEQAAPPPAATSAPASSAPAAGVTGKAAVDTPASKLRADLTQLLTEHVYTAAIALKTAVDAGGKMDDPGVKAAVANLDANSVALSKAIGGAYPAAEAPFLESWRQHIGFFVDYTLGKATKDQAKVDKAKADLDGYRTSFGQLINSVVPELPAAAVAEELKPHTASVFATIDSLVAGDGQVFAKLTEAAGHMPMTAATLAGGIAKNKGLEGDVNSPAAGLRAGLTHLLTSHVDLAGIALAQAVAKGGDLNEPSVKAAVAAVDSNSVALSKAVGSAYPAAEAPFLESWRQHIGFFVDYTLGKATKDQAKMDKAKADLDGYRTSFGQLINSVVPELPAAAVAEELKPHTASVFATIDSLVAGDGQVFTKLAEAAHHMPMTAATLAGGIAENKKLA